MRPIVRTALLAFLLTRIAFFALAIFGSQLTFERQAYSASVWETHVDLSASRLMPELSRVVLMGDSWYYRAIATDGYIGSDETGDRRAFFPLYPMLVRLLGGTDQFVAVALLLSNAAFLLALICVGRIALLSGASSEDASRAIVYLACFPTSYFCSLPLPESLFLLLSSGAWLAALSRRWAFAGLLGALASATRLAGLFLLPALLLTLPREKWRSGLWLSLIPTGVLAFMVHLHLRTGNAFAFVDAQAQWRREAGFPWSPIWKAMVEFPRVSAPWNLIALNLAVALLLLVVGVMLLRERRWPDAIYTLTSVLVPLTSGSLQSISRYAVVVFPLFLFLGRKGRNPSVDRTVLIASLILFGWLVALFVLRIDFALA